MANLSTAMARAQKVSSDLAARRLYNDIEAELSLGDPDPAAESEGEQALDVLEDRFPGIAERARDMEDYAPNLSRSANANVAGGSAGGARSSTAPSSSSGGTGGSSGRGAGRQSRPAPRRRSAGARGRSSSSARRVAERAAGFGGEDVADVVIGGLRWLLLAGLVYQVLQPKGSKAFGGILGGLGQGVRAIVDPVDPFTALGGRSSAAAAIAAASAAGDPATGIGTTDQRQFLATPIHPIATGPSNPIAPYNAAFNRGFNDGYRGLGPQPFPAGSPYIVGFQSGQKAKAKPRAATGALGSHVTQPVSSLQIGNPLGG